MRYFKKIADDIDVSTAAHEVADRWLEIPADLPFKGPGRNPNPPGTRVLSSCRFQEFPAINALMRVAATALGNPFIYRARLRIMPPKSAIAPHRDGLFTGVRRHQLAIQCDSRAVFTIATETCRFKPGELWWINLRNRKHWVVNHSDAPRIVLLIDAGDQPIIGRDRP